MDTVIIYIMADEHIQNDRPVLRIGDICQVYCRDQDVQDYVWRVPVKAVQPDENGRLILSVMDLIEPMLQAAGRRYPELHLQCENLGAQQMIIERKIPVKEKWWLTALKVAFASLVVFTGSAFTIMTYNQDVDVTGVFALIYPMVLGKMPDEPWILETAYAIGIAVGVLLFFNPFTASKQRKEPSPIEIEMEKYEADIRDTILKMDQRESSGR